MNSVTLVGNVGADPRFKELENGKKHISFSLATNQFYTNSKGEKINKTNWHRIVAWDKKAEIISSYIKKGSKLIIQGSLNLRVYETETSKNQISEVLINKVQFLDNKSEN
jgi:single-strand DNA-binding protein